MTAESLPARQSAAGGHRPLQPEAPRVPSRLEKPPPGAINRKDVHSPFPTSRGVHRGSRWLLPFLLLVLTAILPGVLRGASSPTIDNLISKLPDPDQWTNSPLDTALQDPDPMFQDPAFRRLATSLRGRDAQGALDSLRLLAARYPNKPRIQFLHGIFALSLKRYPEAETSFRALIAAKATAPLGWYGVACAQIAQDRPAEAVASLHQAVALQPKFTGAWLLLAIYQARQGQPVRGAEAAHRVTQIAPNLALGWGVLGYCDASAMKYADAIACYRKAIRSASHYAFAYEGLGICYARTDRPHDAIGPLKAALALAPRNYMAATELGYCCLRAGQPADGVKACRQAVETRPGFSQGWDMLGLCYERQGKMRAAAKAFKRAVQEDAANGSARGHLAEIAPKTGR
jgi:tetratricopeptide (TPR) repeat protein